MKCPKCGSKDYIETARVEDCQACGYGFYYGDAHSTGSAQISKKLHYGRPVERDLDDDSDYYAQHQGD